jgi:hypothetical protein
MQTKDSLLHDPLFYITLGFFALLTTGLAAALGQPRFLPISQTVALFVFLTMAIRRGMVREAVWILVVWIVLQIATLSVVTRLVPGQVEQAISNGFFYRTDFLAWFYGGEALPASLAVQPATRLIELAGVLLGSLVTGGLLGVWFLVRAANLAAYSAGALWQDSGFVGHLFAGLPLWTLLRLAGYGGFVVLLAEPLFAGRWSPGYYWQHRRRLILSSATLLVLGLILELLLPSLWRTLLS